MAPVLSKNQKIGLAVAVAVGSINIQKKKRKTWVKEYLLLRDRLSNMNIMSVLEPADFRNYLRMDSRSFDILLNLVTPYIQKQNTILRDNTSDTSTRGKRCTPTEATNRDRTFLNSILIRFLNDLVN